MTDRTTVTSQLQLRLVVPVGPSLPVTTDVRYEASDPWALRVTFRTGDEDAASVEWLFARSLLVDGLSGPAGEGDVRVWPSVRGRSRVVHLAMSSPSGSALFEIDRDGLVEFLQRCYLVVPTGGEGDLVDIDAELSLLLADGR